MAIIEYKGRLPHVKKQQAICNRVSCILTPPFLMRLSRIKDIGSYLIDAECMDKRSRIVELQILVNKKMITTISASHVNW